MDEKKKKLGVHQRRILMEALRRYSRFTLARGEKATITEAWTGLGSLTTYKTVYNAGLMEPIHGLNPGYMCWWKLTPAGAAYVSEWLSQGITHETIEGGRHGYLHTYQLAP